MSEWDDVSESGYYKSALGYDNVYWFVNEVVKLGSKMALCSKNTNKDYNMTQEDEEDFDNITICRFCEKEIISDKVRDHCYLTGKYRGLAHNTSNINVTQIQSNFVPYIFHKFSN